MIVPRTTAALTTHPVINMSNLVAARMAKASTKKKKKGRIVLRECCGPSRHVAEKHLNRVLTLLELSVTPQVMEFVVLVTMFLFHTILRAQRGTRYICGSSFGVSMNGWIVTRYRAARDTLSTACHSITKYHGKASRLPWQLISPSSACVNSSPPPGN